MSDKREIPLSVPNLNIEIADHLRECIETGWVSTGGRFITEFEEKVARYVGAENADDAVGCQSGTAGLHTALRILGVEAGDEVIVPSLTFIAAVNPVRYIGAEPVFMDCDDTMCMDAAKLERFCAEACEVRDDVTASGELVNKATGRIVKAIIPVHVLGYLADMDRIMEIAARYHLKVLEDATEAMGSFFGTGRYAGRHAGMVGDMGVFSFNANKIITTGGGGMIVSGFENGQLRSEYLARSRYLTTTAKDDGLYFAHNEVGYNYRMLNLQAALGVSQIDEIDRFIEIKKRNYKLYGELLSGAPGMRLLPFQSGVRSNHWFYSLLIEDDDAREGEAGKPGGRRDRIMKNLIKEGVQCRPVWKLVHTQVPYAEARAFEIEKATFYEKHILNIPCSTNLSEADVRYVSGLILRESRS
jgi:aminotransferase in exopolysaccharide biosynthesis